MEELRSGLYYSLLNRKLQALIERGRMRGRVVSRKCDRAEIARIFSHELAAEIRKYIEDRLEEAEDAPAILEQYLRTEAFRRTVDDLLPEKPEVLSEVKATAEARPIVADKDIWVGESALLIPDGQSPQLGAEIEKELLSCDRAEWLVSFIKLRAVMAFYPALRRFCASPAPDGGPRLRIATTTYMGASETKALKLLMELDNTEIRMSFDAENTRLHAKAYLFHRDNGFSTVYVGSANLSSSAMSTGLEWTAKFTQWEMPAMWARAKSAFMKSWGNEEKFEPVSLASLPRVEQALRRERGSLHGDAGRDALIPAITLEPRPYQEVVLEAVRRERAAGRHRHLVIAATGTGKTMVAAFDLLKRRAELRRVPSLLYIVHRKDILRQVRNKYRAVMRDENLGVILPDEPYDSGNTLHVFCTPETWASHVRDRWPHKFDCVVMDECHHTAAATYDRIVRYYAADFDGGVSDLLGLTATPDREDGADIRPCYGGSFTHELTLASAIGEGHLVPFTYFAVADESVDLSGVQWRKRSSEAEVQRLLENSLARAENVLAEAGRYVADLRDMRALGFCAGVRHARFMAQVFTGRGIPALCLDGGSSPEERRRALQRLNSFDEKTRVNVIFTADLFNEGVDIPNVDTLFLLRPTNSLTIFTQQLGRGLRRPEYGYDKPSLLVLDFIMRQNESYDDGMRFRALSTNRRVPIERQIDHRMPFLPAGCAVTLTEKARTLVLENINRRLQRMRGQRLIRQIMQWIHDHGRRLGVRELMERLAIASPMRIYVHTKSVPSQLAAAALGKTPLPEGEQKKLARFMLRLGQNDDHRLLRAWKDALANDAPLTDEQKFDFATCMDYQHIRAADVVPTWSRVAADAGLKQDVLDLLDWKLENTLPREERLRTGPGELILHNRYSRTQIMAALGKTGYLPQSGVEKSGDGRNVALFVTRNKSEADFSPSTMYQDYAISLSRFKWDSQNGTRQSSPIARQMFSGEITPLLFVQKNKKAFEEGVPESERTPESFVFLGPVKHVSHEGECPIAFEWELATPMPAEVYEWAK